MIFRGIQAHPYNLPPLDELGGVLATGADDATPADDTPDEEVTQDDAGQPDDLVVSSPTDTMQPRTPSARSALPTVAVLDFRGFMLGEGGNSVTIGKALSAMLVREFAARDGINVVDRQQLQALLQQQVAPAARVDEDSAVEVGRLLGVRYVFEGSGVSIATQLRVDIRAIDASPR